MPLIYDDHIVMVFKKEQNHKPPPPPKKTPKENKTKQTNKPKQNKTLKICLEFMNHHCVFILILFWCKCNDNDISPKKAFTTSGLFSLIMYKPGPRWWL